MRSLRRPYGEILDFEVLGPALVHIHAWMKPLMELGKDLKEKHKTLKSSSVSSETQSCFGSEADAKLLKFEPAEGIRIRVMGLSHRLTLCFRVEC